ncbi:hypothetical protein ACQ4PT_019958 [Festuca glaucescens]
MADEGKSRDQGGEKISSDAASSKEGEKAERNRSLSWFSTIEELHWKRLAAESSARGKKSKAVQESQGSRPGTTKRGQNPLVGFLPEAKFCRRFKRMFTGNPCGSLKIPKTFCQHMTGNFLLKISTFGNTWGRVRLVVWRKGIFIDHGWDELGEDNDIAEGDTLFFTYTVDSSMEVAIFGSTSREKNQGPH